ncbi:MAG: ribbon-helix-helix domain-containing protein [Deltaproteobacteria bacterium]|nr:ribbon-helix-helix domain-containing protein [Deltaproteobacteria bacterium]
MKKMLIYIEPAQHERLRKRAFKERVSITELVRQAITEFLKAGKAVKS